MSRPATYRVCAPVTSGTVNATYPSVPLAFASTVSSVLCELSQPMVTGSYGPKPEPVTVTRVPKVLC